MRVTNSMINRNTICNINNNKGNVDTMNTQMSTQKKISRPSEDPVIAIRSLRLRTTLSEINQYYEKNIPDAESWLDVTEGALYNIVSLLGDITTQCNYGANNTLNQNDRNAILEDLKGLKSQIYAEMNTDEAGRSVFGGYKTNKTVSFIKDEPDLSYDITETFTFEDIEQKNYYANKITVPASSELATATIPKESTGNMPSEVTNNRIRMSYGQTESGTNTPVSFSYSYTDENQKTVEVKYGLMADANGKNPGEKDYQETFGQTVTVDGVPATPAGTTVPLATVKMISYSDWQEKGFALKENPNDTSGTDILYVQDTGELIFSDQMKKELETKKATISFTYEKTGFSKEDVRPEMYFDCVEHTKSGDVAYTKEQQDIEYTIAFNQTLTINTQPEDVVDASVARDIEELEEAVQAAIDAHEKYDTIEEKMNADGVSDEDKAKWEQWLNAAQKECDYADENMKKMFSKNIGNFEKHQEKAILARTDVGAKGDRLTLTKNRMLSQQETFGELKSKNEDRELSDIILDYSAAYYAYQASLQAAGKANSTSLLDYI